MGVADVRYEASVEQVSSVYDGFLLVLGEAAADQPADEARPTEYASVGSHAPSAGNQIFVTFILTKTDNFI